MIVARLFYMQIVKHDEYVTDARSEQVKQLTISAKRGEIYALDNGNPVKLALNENVYTAFVDPVEVKDPIKIVKKLKSIAGGNLQADVGKLVVDKPSRYRIVAKDLTSKQAKLLRAENLSGLGLQNAVKRVYPEGSLASQTLGFVNSEGKGQYGAEEYFDSQLKGKDGLLRSVTDVRNVPLTIGDQNTSIPAKNGKNIVLTIDRNIQTYTESALKKQLRKLGGVDGRAVVMDPNNGQVLAMANFPTYNPEKYTEVQNAESFNNGVITAPYEPGSVMKCFTIATSLDKKIMTPNSTYNNTDYITVEDRTISNASKGQTGVITMQHALNWSLNTGMVTLAERLGDGRNITRQARDTMYDYFHNRFGLGEATGIELSGEQQGLLISPNDPEGNAVRYSNMSFGQGMNPTMIQVAAGFSSIVNGGKYYQPTVLAGSVNEDGVYKKRKTQKPLHRTISSAASKTSRQMIRGARQAFYAQSDKPGYFIGGKTGTSQTLVNGQYNFDQTDGTYIGFGGDTKPRYVIMVEVNGKNRALEGTDAMPVFTDISNWLIDYMKLAPRG